MEDGGVGVENGGVGVGSLGVVYGEEGVVPVVMGRKDGGFGVGLD